MARSRRRSRGGDATIREVTGYIEGNPVTSAVIALAAGVVATSVFKMTVGKPSAGVASAPAATVKKTRAKKRAKGSAQKG